MIGRPGMELQFAPADRWQATGPLAERALDFAHRWHRNRHQRLAESATAAHVTIVRAAPEHSGLGTGTQLAMSVAAGLSALFGTADPLADPVDLALAVERGRRSAVGSYGFCQGGLIVEAGKFPDEPIAPIVARCELPADWHFALITPQDTKGISGAAESRAFKRLEAVPAETTARLSQEVLLKMLPAARLGQFEAFAESLYYYGRMAGEVFAPVQGGIYATPELARMVLRLRGAGVRGVGQSSWGPTLFALMPSQLAAEQLAADVISNPSDVAWDARVTSVANHGAQLEVES